MEEKKKGLLVIIALIVISILVFTSMIYLNNQPPDYRNNYTYFQSHPVEVFLEVEDTVSSEGAYFALKTALISLNDTFNYNLSIVSINHFHDEIDVYTDDDLDQCLWDGGEKISDSIENDSICIKITFFDGKGPDRTYFGKTTEAAGISNYGNRIGIFINNPSLDFNSNLHLTFKTILHEFGHAFGMEHNIESVIMYSSEVDPNDDGAPDHPQYANQYSVLDDEYYIVNSIEYQELSPKFINEEQQSLSMLDIADVDSFTFEVPLNISASIPLVNSRTYIDFYAWYENSDLSNVSGVSMEAKYYFDNTTIYVTVNFSCCYFAIDSYSNLWADEEILLCRKV